MNTRAMGDREIADLQAVVTRFQETRPRNQSCVACHCMQWEERLIGGVSTWCCASCRRSASLTSQEWAAHQEHERAAVDAHLAAAAAAAPKPRTVLRDALGRLAEARTAVSKCERAVPAAMAAVGSAQDRHDAAVAAVAVAETNAAASAAASILDGKRPVPMSSAAAASAELAAAIDALVIARTLASSLDGKLKDAKVAAMHANTAQARQHVVVLAAEKLEELIADVIEDKAGYLESVGQLGWLLRNHAITGDQHAARQLVADANTPPSAWPEANTAGTAPMEAALAALLADPAASH